MKIKFSVVAKTLEGAKRQAQKEIERFTNQEGELVVVGSEPYETIYETTLGGESSSRITSWEVDFEYRY